MSKDFNGYCHICGAYGKLTFEHIPPENALNRGQAKLYFGKELLKTLNGEKGKYQHLQRGMGKYSLCANCNNNTGQWYAPAYSKVAKAVACHLRKIADLKHGDVFPFTFKNFSALAFVKQVVTMFCSLLPHAEVQRLGFIDLLLNKESNTVDRALFDLRMYLTSKDTGQLMIGPCSLFYETHAGIERMRISDLCAYPFGFILNLSPNIPVDYGISLMNMFDAAYRKEYNTSSELMYLERADAKFPLPLQFKTLPPTQPEENEQQSL